MLAGLSNRREEASHCDAARSCLKASNIWYLLKANVETKFIKSFVIFFINMDQTRLNLVTILTAFILESSDDEEEPPKKRRSVWVKDWVAYRQQEGCYVKLLTQLRGNEPELYHNFLRMDAAQFDNLLVLISPYIKKADTNMRLSISAGERLVLTLRYLATGESFRSLQYLFRIPATTISRIIPEVLDAIYKVLVGEYLQVSFFFKLAQKH